jgi:hypothetical protein
MSSDTVEGILFSLRSSAEFAERYRAKPGDALEGYPLTDRERRDLIDWNVRAMSESGVSEMLLMVAYTAIFGQDAIPEYIRRMNTPAGSTTSTAG